MRQEIRKQFTGNPRLWEAEIAVDDVAAYLIESSGSLAPLRTGRERRMDLFHTKGETAGKVRRDRRAYAAARAARPTVIIDPDLVLYSLGDDAFYRFDRFTAKYAVFRFLRRNG